MEQKMNSEFSAGTTAKNSTKDDGLHVSPACIKPNVMRLPFSVRNNPLSELYNMDCIEGMKHYPDKYFDLAIVDPPYGLCSKLAHAGNGKNAQSKFTDDFKLKKWDNTIPPYNYFIELFRVSKNQIIWGGNYFLDHLPSTRGFITWDKMVFIPTMSRIEMAWTSFDKLPLFVQINNNDANRIHLTQKPVKLYDHCIDYAKLLIGSRILDTHVGSGSSRIACYNNGFDFVGFEIDEDYCKASEKRFITATAQQSLNFGG
ncbi:MAG TPA: DNA methyltransferase [Hanamia sp.]